MCERLSNYTEDGCAILGAEALLKMPAAFEIYAPARDEMLSDIHFADVHYGSLVCGALDPLLTCSNRF